MSFFGYLAAGAAEGIGKGMVGQADYDDKLRSQQQLLLEKQEGQMRLDAQRAQDRADRERENIVLRGEMKAANRSSGGGGKEGGVGMLLEMAERADTPEKQRMLIETFRAAGDDNAAGVIGRIFGQGDTETVNPSTGDFARFDRQANPETGENTAPVPQSFTQRAQYDAQKGSQAVQRLLAMAAGKYKDYAEGDARMLGTDAVRGALADGGDMAMRKANVVNGALEGKDRFAVQGNTEIDKAGVVAPKTTEVGKAEINRDNAAAGNSSASAQKTRAEIGEGAPGSKASTAASKLEIAKARERRMDIKDQIATTIKEREQGLIDKPTAIARLADLKSKQIQYEKVIDSAESAPAATPAAPVTRPAASSAKTRPPLNSFMK